MTTNRLLYKATNVLSGKEEESNITELPPNERMSILYLIKYQIIINRSLKQPDTIPMFFKKFLLYDLIISTAV